MGFIYGIGVRIMNFMVFFLIVILLPGLPPRTTFPFKEFDVAPTKELKGALEPNNHLDGAERLLDGRVYGPECLIVRNNEIYTGIHGGEVIKLTQDHVTFVTKLGQPCEDIFEESRCGRPLGLAFDTQGNNLIIADAYYGLWLVDLDTNKKKLLVSSHQELPGKNINRKAKIFNSVAVAKSGDIYWTDSSSDFTVQDLVFTSFANPSGRLFKYDRTKNVSKVLLDELYFANGVALSPEEDFIVMAETGSMRLIKYHLKGINEGKSEVFVEGLPGLPDNLTPDADGIWVPLVMSADNNHPNGFSIFSNFPSIRLFLARLLSIFELPFRLVNNAYPNKLAQRFIHFIGHGESIILLANNRATVVRVDWNGNIVGSLHGFDKSVGAVSHVLEFKDQLLLGSPFNRFLSRVKSPKAANVRIKNVRFEGVGIEPVVKPPVEATTAKPVPPGKAPKINTATPTTPKPTTVSHKEAPVKAAEAKKENTVKPTKAPTQTPTSAPVPPTKAPIPTTAKPKPTASPPTPKVNVNTEKKPTTKTTPKPASASTPKRVPPKEPAPITEEIDDDIKLPQQPKLKVINKQGDHVEL